MGNALLTSRIKYLDDASNHLLRTSPAISAHLQVVRQSIIGDKDGAYHSNREPSCTVCGNVLIPGWSCENVTNASAKQTRKERLTKKAGSIKTVKLRCHKCNAMTSIDSVTSTTECRKPHEKLRLQADAVPSTTTTDSTEQTSAPEDTIKQSSRKRSRNKRPTLQSILADRKATEPSTNGGFGLDLMDLMKP